MVAIDKSKVLGIPVVLPTIQSWLNQTTLGSANLGTITSVVVSYFRVGNRLKAEGKFVSGTTVGAVATISLPSLPSALTSGNTTTVIKGRWWRDNGTATSRKNSNFIITANSTVLSFGNDDYTIGGVPSTPVNGTSVALSGETVFFEYDIIINDWILTEFTAYGQGLATSAKSGLVSYEDSGSFTVYLKSGSVSVGTTASTGVSGTAYYSRVGKQVIVQLPPINATNIDTIFTLSTSNAASTNTWPAGLIPASAGVADTLNANIAGVGTLAYWALSTAGELQFFANASGNNFSAGNTTKGLIKSVLRYTVN